MRYTSDIERFESKYLVDVLNGCWLWNGTVSNYNYGLFWYASRYESAHIFSYRHHIGLYNEPHLDHLCRVTICVNPYHLEPVTVAENNRRRAVAQTHCKNGHEFTEENTYWYRENKQSRRCRICHRASVVAYDQRKRM